MECLARRAGLASQPVTGTYEPSEAPDGVDEQVFAQWLEGIASPYGVEVEPTQSSYAEVKQFVQEAGPAILRLPDGDASATPRFLVLLKGGWRWASLIGPDRAVCKVRLKTLRDALCSEIEVPHIGSIEQLLVSAGVPEHRHDRARRAILNEQLGREQIHHCWLLRLSPGANLWRQVKFYPTSERFEKCLLAFHHKNQRENQKKRAKTKNFRACGGLKGQNNSLIQSVSVKSIIFIIFGFTIAAKRRKNI